MTNINEPKELLSLETRSHKASKLQAKYKNKFPVICIIPKDIILDNKTSYQFMLSGDIDIKCLVKTIIRKVKFKKIVDFFVMTDNGQLLMNDNTIGNTVEKYNDEDGFLYLYFKLPFC